MSNEVSSVRNPTPQQSSYSGRNSDIEAASEAPPEDRETAAGADNIVPVETGKFPGLFNHLPRFTGIAVENGEVAMEPVTVNLYRSHWAGRWLLVVSFPGLNFPYGPASAQQFFKKAAKFEELSCDVFILTIDPWSKLRSWRDNLELKERDNPDGIIRNAKNVHFVADADREISRKFFKVLSVVGSGESQVAMNYPAYFLMTPDKELVQFCVIRDSKNLFQTSGKTFFGYPFSHEVVKSLVETIAMLKPVYAAVERVKVNYPKATFGTYMADMLRTVKEGDNKWKGLAKAAEGVFRGGVH